MTILKQEALQFGNINMSEEEKIIESHKPVTVEKASEWWNRGKKLVLLYHFGIACFTIIGVVWGVGVTIENKIVEVLAAPKRIATIEKKSDSSLSAYDAIHHKQDSLFYYIFDTTFTYK